MSQGTGMSTRQSRLRGASATHGSPYKRGRFEGRGRGAGPRRDYMQNNTHRPRHESTTSDPFNTNTNYSNTFQGYRPQVAEYVHHADAAAATTAEDATLQGNRRTSRNTSNTNNKRDVVVILEKAGLVLGHRGLVDAYERAASTEIANPSLIDIRPELVHQCLLALYDSDLAHAHRLRVYISLLPRPGNPSKVIEVSPGLRPPRSFARFRSLIVALLRDGKVSSAEGEVLMRIMPGSIAPIIPFGAEVTGLCNQLTAPVMTATGLAQAAAAAPVSDTLQGGVKNVAAFYCVACNEESNVDGVEYVTRRVCLSAYPMSSAVMCARICHAHAHTSTEGTNIEAIMASLLPYDFRCLRHVRHLYARNLPVDFSNAHRQTTTYDSKEEVQEKPQDVANDTPASRRLSSLSSGASHSSTAIVNDTLQLEANSSSSSSSSASAVQSCELGSFFIIRVHKGNPISPNSSDTESTVEVYRSEVCSGTPHPVWATLPGRLITQYGALTHFTLELHHQLRTKHNNRESSDENDDVREYVWSFAVDMRALQYVAATMSEADMSDTLPRADSETGCALLFRCDDGVFAYTPRSTPSSSDEVKRAAEEGSRKDDEVKWSRSPGGVGLYEYINSTSSPRTLTRVESRTASPTPATNITQQQQQASPVILRSPAMRPAASTNAIDTTTTTSNTNSDAMTLGDVKTLATGTVAWGWLRRIDAARRASLLHVTEELMHNTANVSDNDDGNVVHCVADEAAYAAAQAKLSAAEEQLSLRTLELEQEMRMIDDTRLVLAKQERELLKYNGRHVKSDDDDKEEEGLREDNVQHEHALPDCSERVVAELRAQVARGRQAALQQLRGFFPLQLVPDDIYYVYSSSSSYLLPITTTSSTSRRGVGAHTAGKAELLRDTLCDMPLPFFPDITHWEENNTRSNDILDTSNETWLSEAALRKWLTAAEMQRESIALGYAAQLVRVMATLYAFTLPYPLLIAGAHSRIIAKPELYTSNNTNSNDDTQRPAEQRISLPLYYHALSERPLLAKAVRLLMFDLVALAVCVGRDEKTIAECGMRVGKALHLVLGMN